MKTKALIAIPLVISMVTLISACTGDAGQAVRPDVPEDEIYIPEESTFFSTVWVDETTRTFSDSNGDLWPAAWSDDDRLYAAMGDGRGFDWSQPWADIVVNRIDGHPASDDLSGERLAAGEQVGKVWSDPEKYNKKPTGMASVDGDLYLAVQDLNKQQGAPAFNDAPAATILKSTDKGKTWTFDPSKPMFDDYTFTTIMFLDYGKDGSNNTFDDYVYAYGLDGNWRDSFSDAVPDPTKLYLARMPKDAVQDASRWEYYAGDLYGHARWTEPGKLENRKPVLRDDRRVYKELLGEGLSNMAVLSQSNVVYNKPLERYIYASWTEFTFEFYEAPKPWGPWKRFFSKDFGVYPWTPEKHGGYATVIPSKFISEDGKTMWVNGNTFVGGVEIYNFSLRQLKVTPYKKSKAANKKSGSNLALPENGGDATPISRSNHYGNGRSVHEGAKDRSEDSWNGEAKSEDYWGMTWSQAYKMNKLVYTTGGMFEDGGWFEDFRVQVRRNFEWIDVEGVVVSPAYPFDETAGAFAEYEFRFDETQGDGVRIVGTPGGASKFTSVAELEVYYSE
ncbi:DUF4185 domain-containing protein [Paenibacillus antri]|uniref:DUF4185 domain-containing protein n=1 Tax=Paenibacillus antri TaxID=2582848 RepID=A0A5R9FZN5_9BACL|nr:DUF4185 domain-containing protein [Paenibacillus antri]TLS49522.1 DUF4185 domain-containing protein [Paenibacillus antri]